MMNNHHQYGNIENDSALVTSQINDSPKGMSEMSERLETRKLKSFETDMILNKHQLPQLNLVCYSVKVFDDIIAQLGWRCVLREWNQIILMDVSNLNICDKIGNEICRPPAIASRSNNGILRIRFIEHKLEVSSLSGNYKKMEEATVNAISIIRRFNMRDTDHCLDNKYQSSPYSQMSLHINDVYQHLMNSNIFLTRINKITSTLTQPLKRIELQAQISECTQLALDMLQLFKENNQKKNHIYYHLQIEKCLFEQIHDLIFGQYIALFAKNEEEMQRKKFVINQQTDQEIMAFLEIKKKFQRADYGNGINEFTVINHVRTPREKLRSLQMMHSVIKAYVYEHSQEELTTMDDELPIMIFVTQRTPLINAYASIAYIDDFARTDPTIETEKRIIANIKGGLDYILKDWKI